MPRGYAYFSLAFYFNLLDGLQGYSSLWNAVVRLSDVKNLVNQCVKKVDFSLRFGLTFVNGHVLTMETFWHCLVYNILHIFADIPEFVEFYTFENWNLVVLK